MAKITTPVKGYTGKVAGVSFVDGEGETTEASAIAYFGRHGYEIEQTEKPVDIPEGKPSTEWKADQLKAYASEHSIDLGAAKSKPEIVEAIEKADTSPAGDDQQ